MPEAPDISVVVPCYQGVAHLPRLLGAFRRQRTKRAWELLVVLDGPDAASEALLARDGGGLPLRVVLLPEKQGRPTALNAGFEAARGQVLIRCDHDLEPRPDYLERHAGWHDDSTRRAVIGLSRDVFTASRYGDVYGRSADDRRLHEAYGRPPSQRWAYWAANCSVHRETWEKVGPYDKRFQDRVEDGEWGYRLMQAGAEIVLDKALEVDHHCPALTSSRRLDTSFLTGRAYALLESLHGIAMELDPPRTPRERIWRLLVSAGAWRGHRARYRRLGRLIDVALPHLPEPMASRLVAWGVESAGLAGKRLGAGE